jgi:hypothetical protein
MKIALVSSLIFFLVIGCTSNRPVPASQVSEEKPLLTTSVKKPIVLPQRKNVRRKSLRHQVFWRLVHVQEITLILEPLDSKNKSRSLVLNQDVFYHSLPAGEWWIRGLKFKGEVFEAMNTSQRATFRVHKDSYSYAGALLVQCPKVGQDHFEELKLMKFFNRYSFSSDRGLCEIVLGNDYDLIKDAWKTPGPSGGSKLILGL